MTPNRFFRVGRTSWTLLALLLGAGWAAAQAPAPPDHSGVADELARRLDQVDASQTPALALLVARDGQVLFRRAIGLADLEQQIAATPKTKFRIGSITKQFTAAAILRLAAEKKLSLDDTLDAHLPDYPRGDDITIHQLLNHTSGIPSFTELPGFWEKVTEPTTEAEVIASFRDQPLSFEPGSKYHYNNSGYFLLGHIVGKVSGKPFGEYLQETFFGPLGMKDTGMHSPDLNLQHEALGYSLEDDAFKPALNWHMSQVDGAGALYSTVDDLMLWNEALFNGKVLPPEQLKAAFTPYQNGYGYGLLIGEHRGLRTIGHDGGLNGFVSSLVRYPDQQLTIVALHNAFPSVPEMTPTVVSRVVGELFLDGEMAPREVHEVDTNVTPETLARYVGRYDYGAAVLVVTLEDGQLFAQLTGQGKAEIFPKSETELFWKIVDASVEFQVDAEGRCTAAKHTQNGQTFTAKRLPDHATVQLPVETLDRYVGTYDYGAAKMIIRRDGERLLAKLGNQPEFPILPENETTFHWQVVEASIQFTVDDEGTVSGAMHTQGGRQFPVNKIPAAPVKEEEAP
ncbi:serine hydrolase [Roseimaritima ulvae]|uniref:Penicillin-binding protein 4 n=1 Tax=Roseimaritima ulvae TaxID=980254 RepID=A0A5B9QVI8_9BACT|nr:serine hydrolase [Roseimaritima ulvae]QEG43067.1 Penicillin-binding protein 4* [Roseimaritima ulvae]